MNFQRVSSSRVADAFSVSFTSERAVSKGEPVPCIYRAGCGVRATLKYLIHWTRAEIIDVPVL